MAEDNPNLEVNGLWDLATGQALQAFLKIQVGPHSPHEHHTATTR